MALAAAAAMTIGCGRVGYGVFDVESGAHDAAMDTAIDGAFDGSADATPGGDAALDAARDASLSEDASFDAPSGDAALDASDGGSRPRFDLRIDFGTGASPPGGSWASLDSTQQNSTIDALPDFVSGVPSATSLSSTGWLSAGNASENWTAGDVGWLAGVAAQDAWGGTSPSTLRFEPVDGRVRVEVVAVNGFEYPDVNIAVNGATSTLSHRERSIDSAAWRPREDGTLEADWIVFDEVAPSAGVVDVTFSPGLVSAVRLVALD